MFDSKKLELPLNLIIDSITPNVDKIVLEKDKTKVLTVDTNPSYYNTLATVGDITPETTDVTNLRDILYDRVDIGQFIKERAKLVQLPDLTFEYVLISDDVETTTSRAGASLISRVLNKNYELPISSDDLLTVTPYPYYFKSSSFGNLYLLANGVVNGDTINYVKGTAVVYHLPDTTTYSYNKPKSTQTGMSFYRIWDADEILEITLPSSDAAESWSMQIEDVVDINSIGGSKQWIKVRFNNLDSTWEVSNLDGGSYVIPGDTITKIKLYMTADSIVIEGLVLVNNNSYVSQFKDTTTPSVYQRGLNRFTMYSSNPLADNISFKFTSDVNEESAKSLLTPNYKKYIERTPVIGATASSNALFGTIDYPVKVTKYDLVGYNQPSMDTIFNGTATMGQLSTIDSFSIDNMQTVVFNIDKFNDLIKDGKVNKLVFKVTSKSDVNLKYETICKPIQTDGVYDKLQFTTSQNGVVTAVLDKLVAEGDAIFKVNTSVYGSEIIKDGALATPAIGYFISPLVFSSVNRHYVVSLNLIMNDVTLPTIELQKEYTPSISS